MNLLLRFMVLIFVVPATYYFVYWLPFSLIPVGDHRWIANVASLLCAAVAGWFVWARLASADRGAVASILTGAVVLGSIGFVGGFFGPILLTPDANQGPLLGIFITGPLGFVLGGIAGLIFWMVKGRTSPRG